MWNDDDLVVLDVVLEEEWKDNKHSKTDNRQIKATNRSMPELPESHHQKAYDIISEIASSSSSHIFRRLKI